MVSGVFVLFLPCGLCGRICPCQASSCLSNAIICPHVSPCRAASSHLHLSVPCLLVGGFVAVVVVVGKSKEGRGQEVGWVKKRG